MKKHLLFFISLVFSAQLACAENETRGYIVETGQEAPDFKMQLTSGDWVNKSDLLGKVVMLQFTASWCGVCRKEMPFIEDEIWQKYKDRSDFVLIGVDRDEPLKTVQKFAEDMKITYPLALDPNANVFALFAEKQAGVTRNVIIGKDGKIKLLTRLFNEQEFEEMKAKIAELLTE